MTDLTGAERVVVDSWIPAALATQTVALDAISPGLSGRIFPDMAPYGETYPFIVYQCQSDPVDVRGVGITTIMTETTYIVKVVAASDYLTLGAVVAIVNAALTTASPVLPAAGGTIVSSVKTKGFSLTETVDGKEVRNLGGFYDIFVQGHV